MRVASAASARRYHFPSEVSIRYQQAISMKFPAFSISPKSSPSLAARSSVLRLLGRPVGRAFARTAALSPETVKKNES